MPLSLNIGKCTLLGNYRENNEDSIEVKQFPELTVCIVADGMGGQQAGEIASQKAIEIIPRVLRKNLAAGTKPDDVGPAVKNAIVQANDRFMLCSDGLSGAAPDERVLEFMLAQPDPQACADGLGQLALECGSRDNVSVIVIDVVEAR